MAIHFDLSALDGLDNEIASAGERLERLIGGTAAKNEIKAALEPVNRDARNRINSITGGLAGGIETKVTPHLDAPTEIEFGISYKRHPESRHAHLVEGGHGGPHGPAAAHPFWGPAIQAHGEEAVDALEDKLNDLIDDIFG